MTRIGFDTDPDDFWNDARRKKARERFWSEEEQEKRRQRALIIAREQGWLTDEGFVWERDGDA